jgi:hypothetical protein
MSRRNRVWLQSAVIAASLLAVLGCGAEKGAYTHLFPLPREVDGIGGLGDIAEYRDSTLYDFLDGGAELYFDYDIVAVADAEYETDSGATVEASVYDMGNAARAFGIYSTIRYDGADFVDVGNEGVKTESSLDFWKGRYYVRLLAYETPPGTEAVILALGRALAGNITESGDLPDIISLLPTESMVPRSEKYFLKALALNNIHYVAPGNVLLLDDETEGVVARYGRSGTETTGFIISYPDVARAAQAFESYVAYLRGEGTLRSRDWSAEVVFENGTRCLFAARQTYVFGVWDVRDASKDYGFIRKALAKIDQRLRSRKE